MQISVLASGSNGNCCFVETKKAALLIDAGKSCREIEARMNSLGKSLAAVSAILLTHAHTDHVASAGVISRKYKAPIYITTEAYEEAEFKIGNGGAIIKHFSSGKEFLINGQRVKPVLTSHSTPSCGFVIEEGSREGGSRAKSFGIFTDTGIVTKEMEKSFPKLGAVLLESNHDIDMLIKGPYPYYLKQWILSERGHLSNIAASQLINEKGENLSLVLLGHLSGNNNTPEVAKNTFEALVKRKIEYKVCLRDRVSGSWSV